jgi:hypothetical protein
MKNVKVVKRLGMYFIIYGSVLLALSFIGNAAKPSPIMLYSIIIFGLIIGPGIWLVKVANKMKDELPGEIKKCPYCAEDVNKDAVICKHCKKDL